MSQHSTTRVTFHVSKAKAKKADIPQAAYTALDRLGQPGAHLVLFGSQNYILSEKIPLNFHLSDKTLAILQAQEWVTCAKRTDQGSLECSLTPKGWTLINKRQTLRRGHNFVQLEMALS